MKGPTRGAPRPREPADGAKPVRGAPCTHPGAAGDEPCRVPAVNGSKRAATSGGQAGWYRGATLRPYQGRSFCIL